VWAYAAFVGWGALSLLWTANRYSTVLWLVLFAIAGLVFRLSYVVAGEAQGRQRLVWAYLASAGLFSLYGLWLYFTSDYDRFTGSFFWANPAAAYLIPAILLSLHGLRVQGRQRWAWCGLGLLFGTSFLLTDSRAATLVLVFVAGLYLLVQKLPKRYWIIFVFTILGAYMLSYGSAQLRHILNPKANITAPGSRFAEAASGESKSASDRLQYLVSAANMWFAHPLGGTGAGTYGDVHPQYQGRVVSASTSAHNMYVQTLAELGIVGAALLAWWLFALLLGLLRGLIRLSDGGVPLALGLLGLMLHAGLDIDARYPAIVLLAAILGGMVYAQAREGHAHVRWTLPALATLVLVPVVGLYQSDVLAQRAKANQADGDYQLAADQYGRAHATVAYNPDTINAEGIDLYTLAAFSPNPSGYLNRALDRAKQAEVQDPWDGQHHQLEGRVLVHQQQYTAATKAFREALRIDPYNHPEYALDLADLQRQLGETDGALKTAHAMLAQYPDAVLDNRNNDQTLRPTVANLWAVVGNIELSRGNIPAAKAAVGRALTVYPASLRGRALKHQVDSH